MSVTAAQGFRAAGITIGLKASGRPDIALVVNDGPLDVGAGVFTSNRVTAAPVVVSREYLEDGRAKAVILNSGCANACTGQPGIEDAHKTATYVGNALGIRPEDVMVCSTGLIGARLDMDLLLRGADAAIPVLSREGGKDAAEAICTTDTCRKESVRQVGKATIGGMGKGAGMLAPGLATMLVVITTDAVIGAEQANAALQRAGELTFDRIDSDGCMSTNDTVLLLASGASGYEPEAAEFEAALTEVCGDIARQLIADAEGSSHDVEVTVVGASDEEAALAVARAVTRSNLFKAAIFGQDPNWGRVVSAVGTVPATVAPYDPYELDVTVNGIMVCRAGGVGDDRYLVDMKEREVKVVVDLHAGDATATIWTNDLTFDYVHENSAYST